MGFKNHPEKSKKKTAEKPEKWAKYPKNPKKVIKKTAAKPWRILRKNSSNCATQPISILYDIVSSNGSGHTRNLGFGFWKCRVEELGFMASWIIGFSSFFATFFKKWIAHWRRAAKLWKIIKYMPKIWQKMKGKKLLFNLPINPFFSGWLFWVPENPI